MNIEISKEELEDYRSKNGWCSIYDAKKDLIKQKLLFRVENAYTIDGLREILKYVITEKF